MRRLGTLAGLCVLFAPLEARGDTYYVDYQGGSDANDGASTSTS
jgi:hypothetical protein